jgi:hypothetical protein
VCADLVPAFANCCRSHRPIISPPIIHTSEYEKPSFHRRDSINTKGTLKEPISDSQRIPRPPANADVHLSPAWFLNSCPPQGLLT